MPLLTQENTSSEGNLPSDEVFLFYLTKLKKILYGMVPNKDSSMIDDYVQDCMIFIINELNKNPDKVFNSSYLRSIATKICVDTVRSKASNTKYRCVYCGSFFPRKEKAKHCCDGKKDNLELSFFIERYEVSLAILNSPQYKINEIDNRMSLVEKLESDELYNKFTSYLNEEELSILEMKLDNKKRGYICKVLNISHSYYKSVIYYFRLIYYSLLSKGMI